MKNRLSIIALLAANSIPLAGVISTVGLFSLSCFGRHVAVHPRPPLFRLSPALRTSRFQCPMDVQVRVLFLALV